MENCQMKYLFFVPIALFLCSFAFERDIKSPESIPGYNVTYIKEDKNLDKGTGMAVFTFTTYNGYVQGDSVRLSYNGKETKVATTKDGKAYLGMKSGKYKFQFYYNSEHFEVYTDSVLVKEQWQTGIAVNFESSLYPVEAEKPVIYVYPDATQNVTLLLNVNGTMGFTYPATNAPVKSNANQYGWNFSADPDGTIHMNDKQYDYLFWDAQVNINVTKVDQNSGFVVKRENLSAFFEEKLTAMGLNPREREDFITYWAPQMQKNETSFIHFMFTEEYDQVATISIDPKPDHLFRVFMLWDDASKLYTGNVREQKIESFTRDGFSVVEWGGAKVNFLSVQQNVN
jgi:hypothetical protein